MPTSRHLDMAAAAERAHRLRFHSGWRAAHWEAVEEETRRAASATFLINRALGDFTEEAAGDAAIKSVFRHG